MNEKGVFNQANIRVATIDDKIVGVAVVLNEPLTQTIDCRYAVGEKGVHACENYFNKLNDYFDSSEMTYIVCLSVSSKMRGRRIGEIMLKSIINNSTSDKQKLHVLSDNSVAIRLYEKYGFQRSSELIEGYAYEAPVPECYEMIRMPK